MRSIRSTITPALAALELTFRAWPGLYRVLYRALREGLSPRETRERVAAWQHEWAKHLLGWTNRRRNISVRYCYTAEVRAAIADPTQQLIVVSNHQSYDDIPLLFVGLRDRALRWPVKWLVRLLPAIGKSTAVTLGAFLWRGSSPADAERMRRMACYARYDGASVVIFPEGHRWHKKYATPTYKKLLRPHIRGLHLLYEELPGYTFVDVTIKRQQTEDGLLVTVYARIRYVPAGLTWQELQALVANVWWTEKDALLSA